MAIEAEPRVRAEEEGGAGVELARMLTIVRRTLSHYKLIGAILLIGVSAGIAVAVLKKPSFRSETIVIYRQGVRLNEERGGVSLTLGARLQEMLLARSRLEGLIEELSLYQKEKEKQGIVEAVEQFRKDVTFKARSTDTFSISYKGKEPENVQKVTARLAQLLVEENQRLRVEQARVQAEFLTTERDRAALQLKERERSLAEFLALHPEFALDQNASASGVAIRAREREEQKGGVRDATLDALRRQSVRFEAALTGETNVSRTAAAADPEVEAARQAAEGRLASAKADLNQKKASFTDQHPDVIAAKQRVSEAEAALKSAEEKVAASRLANASAVGPGVDPAEAKRQLQDKKRKLDAEIAARQKRLDGAKDPVVPESAEATSIVSLETDWARLSRDVSEARDQMNELERNYFRAQIEASSSLGGYSDQVVVLDPAYLPTRPEPPGKTLIVVLAAAASLGLAFVIALLRALLDTRIYEESDLSRISPVLAVVPRAGRRGFFRRS